MMREEQPYISAEAQRLPELAADRLKDGWRLVVVTALQDPQGLEISYVFEKGQKVEGLRVRLSLDQAVVPSITSSYLAAFTYENELQDLFGVKVEGLAVDFKGQFYMKKRPNPFLKEPKEGAAAPGGVRG
jgi:ech hydrogenase subunit D